MAFSVFKLFGHSIEHTEKKIVEQTEQQQQQKYSSSKWTVQTMFNSIKQM